MSLWQMIYCYEDKFITFNMISHHVAHKCYANGNEIGKNQFMPKGLEAFSF